MSQSEKFPSNDSALPTGPVTYSVSTTDKSQFDMLATLMAAVNEEATATGDSTPKPMAESQSAAPALPGAATATTEPPAAQEQSGPADEQGNERVTIYTTLDQVFQIEDVRLMFKRTHRLKLTKSRLMATMLEVAIEDFLKHGRASLLGKRLLGGEAAG